MQDLSRDGNSVLAGFSIIANGGGGARSGRAAKLWLARYGPIVRLCFVRLVTEKKTRGGVSTEVPSAHSRGVQDAGVKENPASCDLNYPDLIPASSSPGAASTSHENVVAER